MSTSDRAHSLSQELATLTGKAASSSSSRPAVVIKTRITLARLLRLPSIGRLEGHGSWAVDGPGSGSRGRLPFLIEGLAGIPLGGMWFLSELYTCSVFFGQALPGIFISPINLHVFYFWAVFLYRVFASEKHPQKLNRHSVFY